MKDIILFPYNGNAREAVSIIQDINRINPTWNIIGFVDDDESKHGEIFAGIEVLGGREVLETHLKAYVLAVPGSPNTYSVRDKIIHSLPVQEDRFTQIIHPYACVGEEVFIGKNVLIMQHVVLTAGVNIGDHVIILPNTVISHESNIGNYTLIGSNVSVSGGVNIEASCYVGSGAKVIQNVNIQKKALVGLGSVVIQDVATNKRVVGNPAKEIKK